MTVLNFAVLLVRRGLFVPGVPSVFVSFKQYGVRLFVPYLLEGLNSGAVGRRVAAFAFSASTGVPPT